MSRKTDRADAAQAMPLVDRLEHRPPSATPAWIAPSRQEETRVLGLPEADHAVPERLGAQSLFQQSLADAHQEAELEGLRTAQEKVEAIIERYLDALQRLQELSGMAARPTAHEVTVLALLIAREVIHREISIDRDIVIEAVDRALSSVSLDNDVCVRLSETDATYIKKRRPEMFGSNVSVVVDAKLSLGDCVVETPGRVIDGCLLPRLDAIGKALEEALDPHEAKDE